MGIRNEAKLQQLTNRGAIIDDLLIKNSLKMFNE